MNPWDRSDHYGDYREYDPYDIRPLDFAKGKLRYLKRQGWKPVPCYVRSFLTWLYYMEKLRYLIANGMVVYLERLIDDRYEPDRRQDN